MQTIHTYFDTQLPYAYVHLIAFMVALTNLATAMRCGVVLANAFTRVRPLSLLNELILGNRLCSDAPTPSFCCFACLISRGCSLLRGSPVGGGKTSQPVEVFIATSRQFE